MGIMRDIKDGGRVIPFASSRAHSTPVNGYEQTLPAPGWQPSS